MLLVAGFGLAVMLIVLALILNTAIFTENIATRSSDIVGGEDALQLRSSAKAGVGDGMEFANYKNNSTYSDLNTSVNNSVDKIDNGTLRLFSGSGTVTNLSVKRLYRGARIFQHSDENFSSEADDRNWTVVQDLDTTAATNVRNFTITAVEGELAQAPQGNATGTFAVRFEDNAGAIRDVHVYRDSGATNDVVVVVKDASGRLGDCTRTVFGAGEDSRVNISLTDGTIEGETCNALQTKVFPAITVASPIDIEYRNTHEKALTPDFPTVTTTGGDAYTIKGEYSLIVNQSESIVDSVINSVVTLSPHTSKAVYSTRVNLTYDSRRLLYITKVRVAPGEPDD